MKKQKINKIVVKSTILIKELSIKLAYYLAIFAIASASTFSAANAVDIGDGATVSTATKADYNFNTAAKDLDIDDSSAATVNIGDITDVAVTGDIDIVTGGTDALIVNIDSIIMDAGGTAGVMTIKDVDDMTGAMTVNIANNLTLDGTLLVQTLEDSDDDKLTLDINGDVTITGAVDLDADATGATGDVLMNIAGNTTFTAGIDLADVGANGKSFLTFDGTTAQSVTGIIDGQGAGEGTLIISNTAGVTFNSAIGATTLLDLDVNSAAATATFKGAVSIAGDATVTGTSTFQSTLVAPEVLVEATGHAKILGELTATTQLDLAGAGTATIGFGHATASSASAVADVDMSTTATLILDDTVTNAMFVFETTNQDAAGIASGSKIFMPINLTSGQTVKLFSDTDNGGDVDTAVNAALQDTALMTYVSAEASQVVTITATATTDAARATSLGITSDQAKAVSQAYLSVINNTNADATAEDAFANAMSGINGMTSTTDTALALQVAPQSDAISGSTSATRAMTGTVQGIVSNRMASLRSGDAYITGMSAGDGMSANSGFIQAFGSDAEQDNVKKSGATVYGYDADTSGVAIGFDVITDTGATLGLSTSFSSTDITGKGTGKATNSIDSYTVSVYTDRVTDSGYLEGSLTYGINDNTAARLVNTAGLNRSYTSTYDSSQLSFNVSAGTPYDMGNATFITPYGSFVGSVISTDAYTEKSVTANDNLRLKIAQDDVTSMVGSIGVKAHKITDSGTPMISFAINNEFGDTKINTTNTYQGGGTAFKTSTDVEELSATLGFGYSFGSEMTSLEIGYETEWNDADYVSTYGSVKIVSKF